MSTQYDVIVVGAGIIGLSLAWRLTQRGAQVLLIERNRQAGAEATYAAAGMLADLDPGLPVELRQLAHHSAALYPDFVHELEAETGRTIELRRDGVIALETYPPAARPGIEPLSRERTQQLEPQLATESTPAYAMQEATVDPRELSAALLAALESRHVELHLGETAARVTIQQHRAVGIETDRGSYRAAQIVNCCGAWAAQFRGFRLPSIPVKGHMVAVAFPEEIATPRGPAREAMRRLRHVVRGHGCYIVPRQNGRYVIGSTIEPAGYDKSILVPRIRKLQAAAARLVPALAEAKIAEAWCGLRPGTKDNLPYLGATGVAGYFAACGHYRDGILLAPATAELLTAMLTETPLPALDLTHFSPTRFA